MRLQLSARLVALTGCAALVVPATDVASGEPRVVWSTREGVYQDSDRTFVNTSATSITGLPHEHLSLSGQYLLDAVSSASVDVVTQATGRFLDLRHEGATGIVWNDGTNMAGGRYLYSRENDWESHNGNLAWSRDFLAHNITLGASLGYQFNNITRANSLGFHERLQTVLGTLWLTITASKRDLVQMTVAPSYNDGFQSSPYRYLQVGDETLLETHPSQRFRQAFVLRHARHVLRDSSVQTHVRGYFDTWGIGALTFGVEYLHGLRGLTLSAFARGYGQNGARFWRSEYAQVERYMSFDKEASPFLDLFAGVRLQHLKERQGVLKQIRFDLRVAGNYFHYFDFPRLPQRGGIVADVGLSLGF